MARINVHPSRLSNRPIHEPAATQAFEPLVELERMVSCCLLGENQFYVNGHDIAERIFELATQLPPAEVAGIAMRARLDLGLRHVPLLLLVALSNTKGNGGEIRAAAYHILRTPKDAMDLIALYWSKMPHGTEQKRRPLPYSFKQALRDGFARWSNFQIQRYATLTNVAVRLRDLMLLVHPHPETPVRSALFKDVVNNTVHSPDTWESALAVPGADKYEVWTRLLTEHKLGALALVRNLRNMIEANVNPALIGIELDECKASDIWPWQILAAAREAPLLIGGLDRLMIRSAGALPQISGTTGVLVDVSGSMDEPLSAHGTMMRMDAAAGLAVILRESCERIKLASFSDYLVFVDHRESRGATLAAAVVNSQQHSGTNLGGAVNLFMQRIKADFSHQDSENWAKCDRLVIITDEQSQSYVPDPIGIPVFIINLASYQRGVDFRGEVTRINGWSGGVVRFLAQQIVGTVIGASDEEE